MPAAPAWLGAGKAPRLGARAHRSSRVAQRPPQDRGEAGCRAFCPQQGPTLGKYSLTLETITCDKASAEISEKGRRLTPWGQRGGSGSGKVRPETGRSPGHGKGSPEARAWRAHTALGGHCAVGLRCGFRAVATGEEQRCKPAIAGHCSEGQPRPGRGHTVPSTPWDSCSRSRRLVRACRSSPPAPSPPAALLVSPHLLAHHLLVDMLSIQRYAASAGHLRPQAQAAPSPPFLGQARRAAETGRPPGRQGTENPRRKQ